MAILTGAVLCLVVAAIAWVVVVDGSAGSASAGSGPAGSDSNRTAIRIVSLSPALSRIVVDLGLEDRLVGRSTYCSFLDPALPIVGDLLRIDYERLIAVEPTHLVVQAPAAGVDAALLALAAERGWVVATWTGLDTIDDIESVVRDMPAQLFAAPGPERDTCTRRAADLINEIAAALSPFGTDGTARSFAGPTLIVHRVDPVSVFGQGTYLHEVLTRLGGTNAVALRGWATLTLEDVTRLNPAAIVVVRDEVARPTDPVTADDLDRALGPLADLSIDAVERRRVGVLAHPDALLPCTGVIGVARAFRAVLQDLAVEREATP